MAPCLRRTAQDSRFTDIGTPKNIWAISSIHGNLERLFALHDTLLPHISPGDRIVYLGNYMGYGKDTPAVLDEILTFRRIVLAQRGMMAGEIIYLRGAQEEMWEKLLQLQFAPDPTSVLLWMLGNGLSNTLHAYGLNPHDGIEACRQGIVGLSKWVNIIRQTMRKNAGHEVFGTNLVRAAYTSSGFNHPMLFVHAGMDPDKSLEDQGDSFWWGHELFENMTSPYAHFDKVVRGYDPRHKGLNMNCNTATIDGGCGFGGHLVCAGFGQNGQLLGTIEC